MSLKVMFISRDIELAAIVYPFAQLHPNVGARLRSEILLLPPTLLNPSSNFGDGNSSDLFGNGSLRTNSSLEYAEPGENSASDDTAPAASGGHFMLPRQLPFLAGIGAAPGDDPPVSPAPPALRPSDLLHLRFPCRRPAPPLRVRHPARLRSTRFRGRGTRGCRIFLGPDTRIIYGWRPGIAGIPYTDHTGLAWILCAACACVASSAASTTCNSS